MTKIKEKNTTKGRRRIRTVGLIAGGGWWCVTEHEGERDGMVVKV
jgi:hypothetical protein